MLVIVIVFHRESIVRFVRVEWLITVIKFGIFTAIFRCYVGGMWALVFQRTAWWCISTGWIRVEINGRFISPATVQQCAVRWKRRCLYGVTLRHLRKYWELKKRPKYYALLLSSIQLSCTFAIVFLLEKISLLYFLRYLLWRDWKNEKKLFWACAIQ